jgi:hypothetical protein
MKIIISCECGFKKYFSIEMVEYYRNDDLIKRQIELHKNECSLYTKINGKFVKKRRII